MDAWLWLFFQVDGTPKLPFLTPPRRRLPAPSGATARGGLFEARGLAWDAAVGAKLVDAAATQIGASVASRGETSYALTAADGTTNATRVASVRKYLEKLVARRAEKEKP